MTSKDEALVLYKGRLVKSKNQIVENADFLMLFIGPIETFFFSVCLFFFLNCLVRDAAVVLMQLSATSLFILFFSIFYTCIWPVCLSDAARTCLSSPAN